MQDTDPVGQALEPGEVVAGHEHGGPAVGQLADQLLEEGPPHHHVEAEGGVVEDQELRGVPQAEGEHHRSPLSPRQPREWASRGHAEAVEPGQHGRLVPARVEGPAEIGELARGHGGRRVGLLGKDADPLHRARPVRPGVVPEEKHLARPRLLLAEKAAHERGLARTVAPEESEDLSRPQPEGDVLQDGAASVADLQAKGGQHRRGCLLLGAHLSSPSGGQADRSSFTACSSVAPSPRAVAAYWAAASRRPSRRSFAPAGRLAFTGERALAPAHLQEIRVGQGLIGLRHRGRIHAQVTGQVAHRGHLGAGPERPRGEQPGEPPLDLVPEGNGARRVDLQLEGHRSVSE